MPCYPDPDKPQKVIYVSSFTSVETDHLFRDYSEKTRQAGINRRSQQITFGIGLKKLIPPPYPRKRRIKPATGLDNERSYYYEFPPLKECREFFEKKMGTVIDWEDDGEE